MKKKLFALSFTAIFLMSMMAVEAYETKEQEYGNQDRYELVFSLVNRAINAVERYNNSLETPNEEVIDLLSGARQDLESANGALEVEDIEEAKLYIQESMAKVKEAAALLNLNQENYEKYLYSKNIRLRVAYNRASLMTKKVNNRGFETPQLDHLLSLTDMSLNKASDHLRDKEFIAANKDLVDAEGYLKDISEIFKETQQWHEFNRKLNVFFDNVPERIELTNRAIEKLRTEYGVDTSQAEELLEDYIDHIELAEGLYDEGNVKDCLKEIYESAKVANKLRKELKDLATMI